MSHDVIIIDDNREFAELCASIITQKCGVEAIGITDPEIVRDEVKNGLVKVIVLDQVMPTVGTELFRQIKTIDKRVRGILISGEPQDPVIMEAINLGFDYGQTKTLQDMEKLPTRILSCIFKYYQSETLVPEHSKLFHSYGVKFKQLIRRDAVKVYLVSYEIIDKNYTFEDDWLTRATVTKGQTITNTQSIDFEKSFDFATSYSHANESETDGKLSFQFKKIFTNELEVKLTTLIKTTFDLKYTETVKNALSMQEKFEIQSDETNVISREYECTKVYWKIKLTFQYDCPFCGLNGLTYRIVYVPVPTIKCRCIDHFSDGSQREYITADIKREYSPDITCLISQNPINF